MDLAVRNNGGVQQMMAQVGRALGGWAARVGGEAVAGLRDQIVQDILEYGDNAMQQINQHAQQWAQQNAARLGHAAREAAESIQGQITQVWQQNANDWNTIISQGIGQFGREVHDDVWATIEDADAVIRANQELINRGNREVAVNADGTVSNSRTNTQMNTGRDGRDNGESTEQPATEAARAISGSSGNPQSKETPISRYPSLTYGFQETHTTVLPYTCWFTAAGLTKGTAPQLKIRMNSIYDMIDMATSNTADRPTAQGFYRDMYRGDNVRSVQTFPEQFASTGSTFTGERPNWRDTWAALYEWYTVLGCEWEIIVHNPMKTSHYVEWLRQDVSDPAPGTSVYRNHYYNMHETPDNNDCILAVEYDSWSTTATATQNVIPPNARYSELRGYKGIRWEPVKGHGGKAVIRGHYKPGSIKRNIVNDGDVKTWIQTTTTWQNANLPTLRDTLVVMPFLDPFNNSGFVNGDATLHTTDWTNNEAVTPPEYIARPGVLHFEVNLKYIVQFKDLKMQARYPTTSESGGAVIINMNNVTDALGTPLSAWGTTDVTP